MRGEAKVTLQQTYCIGLPRDTALLNTRYFYVSVFSTLCFVLSAMDSKIEQCVCIRFCMKLGKFATETLEMLHEGFGEHSLRWTVVFEWHSHFKAGQASVEGDKH
jgi:hypothetical protein